MKTEVSAGGVVARRVRHNWRILLLRDMNGSWTFPKGLVERGEKRQDAAAREITEEVGLTKLEYLGSISPIEYFYRQGSLIRKTVYYFLFQAQGREKLICQKSEGIKEAKWFEFNDAILRVGYAKTNRPLLEKAKKILERMPLRQPADRNDNIT